MGTPISPVLRVRNSTYITCLLVKEECGFTMFIIVPLVSIGTGCVRDFILTLYHVNPSSKYLSKLLLFITIYEIVNLLAVLGWEIWILAFNWSITTTNTKFLATAGIIIWTASDCYGPYVLFFMWQKSKKISSPVNTEMGVQPSVKNNNQ